MTQDLSIYVHWPFCKSKCPYCDFNSHVRDNIQENLWEQAYLKEIEYWQEYLKDKKINSIFFGGGTPSLMEPETIASILDKLSNYSNFSNDIEITLEANPNSTEAEKFSAISAIGINRISIGIQSLNERDLKFLGREHSANEALRAIELADKYFKNFSFDLIYALPGQTLSEWEKQLTYALNFAKYHISLYQLTIEKGTRFFKDVLEKKFSIPDSDFQADLYQLTAEITKNSGFDSYEVSNYAKKKYQSKHNLAYWHYDNYLGFGAGAHSRITKNQEIYALMNYHAPEKWLKEIEHKSHALQQEKIIDKNEAAKEFIMMSLRLKEGLNKENFAQKIGSKLEDFIPQNILNKLEKEGFLTNSQLYLALTDEGRLVLDQLCKYLFDFAEKTI